MLENQPSLSIKEVFGLVSTESLQQGLRGLRGDANTPRHLWDLSTLKILKPVTSIKTWLKIRRSDKRVPIYNYVNRTPSPSSEGYSIKVSQVQDFRGKALSYDSHEGTDFIIPIGHTVVTAAPGIVMRVEREFDRGGLSIMVIHDHGLVTSYNHLGRSLVKVGDQVQRGDALALSGASGLDFVISCFLSPPHVHFNSWVNGLSADPFAKPGETALWRSGNNPVPSSSTGEADKIVDIESLFSKDAIEEALADCIDQKLKARIQSIGWLPERAAHIMYQRIYRPSKFTKFTSLYKESHERTPHLDLPFRADDVSGVHYDASLKSTA